MTTAPVSVEARARRSHSLLESPLTIILVIPQIDQVPEPDVALSAAFPNSTLTEITSSNVGGLGAVPPANPNTATPMARAAYDYIESGANVHVFALPFPVATADAAAARAGKVVSAINTTLAKSTERAKLPSARADVIVVPRECGVGTVANAVVTQLETTCDQAHLGCVALVDAGDIDSAPTARPGADSPSLADVQAWAPVNRNIAIYPFSNRGDVSHYDGMWGSVIAAGHAARYTSRRGLWAHPFNLRDPVLGVGPTEPVRVFDPNDGSSVAVALEREHHVGSIIQYEGPDYIWGARSYSAEPDPRQYLGNHLVANRMLHRSRRTLARFLVDRTKGSTLESLRLSVEKPLQDLYVPGAVQEITALEPVIASGHISIELEVGFYGFIETIKLIAEVYRAEVA